MSVEGLKGVGRNLILMGVRVFWMFASRDGGAIMDKE